MTRKSARDLLEGMYRAAVTGADPSRLVRRALGDPVIARKLDRASRVGLFASGKAAAGMLSGARVGHFDSAMAVLPRGYGSGRRSSGRLRLLFASHPDPDASSVSAARTALDFFRGFGPDDLILCLISGGTSSLLCLPRKGLTLAQKRERIRRAARSGAPIDALNRLRVRLSRVKGGRLGRATEAALVTLLLSDVPGDRPKVIGSGPTIRGRGGDLVRVVGGNGTGLDAAGDFARARGWRVQRAARRISGEAAVAGRRLGRAVADLPPRTVFLAGGESTVRLDAKSGTGGRSLELALAAADSLERANAVLLAAGSDGRDGTSRGAGAFADGTTLRRARALGLDPGEALRGHDSEPFFDALGDVFTPGLTGTNVADWVFAVRR